MFPGRPLPRGLGRERYGRGKRFAATIDDATRRLETVIRSEAQTRRRRVAARSFIEP
jgi:hypothetical protein